MEVEVAKCEMELKGESVGFEILGYVSWKMRNFSQDADWVWYENS